MLKVWLPLDGDLRNLGASNVEVTNNGATIDNNGKIGKCYNFNGSNNKIVNTLSTPINFSIGSLSCWVKMNSLPSSSGFYNLIQLGNLGGYATCRLGIYMEYSNYINISVDGSSTGTNRYTHSIAANQWYHICATNDGTIVKLYINGSEVLSKTVNTSTYTTAAQYLYIGGTSSYYLNGYMNDIRYYDHCLSAAEVHEIAMGLVLHYKLDGGLFGNPNLYTGSKDFTGTWLNSSVWTTAPDTYQGFTVKYRSSSWGGLAQNIPCTNGDIFTISFYGKVDGDGDITSIHRSNLGNVSTGLTILDGNFSTGTNWVTKNEDGTQWKRYWATLQVISSDITYIQWRLENSINGKNLYICGIKLEKGTVATPWCPADSELAIDRTIVSDSSGYGHNSTINGVLTTSSDTAKYTTSSYFGAYNTPNITLNNPTSLLPALTNCTITWWGKYDTTQTLLLTGQTTSHFIAASNNNNYYHGSINSSSPTMYKDGVAGSYKCAADGWHFFCVKGVDLSLWTALKINSYNNAWPIKGYISDFRIYCTPLLDNDIKLLYNIGMRVDNLGGVHTFEFDEISNEKLLKTGILQTNELEETSIQLARLQKDKGWLSSEFIEI